MERTNFNNSENILEFLTELINNFSTYFTSNNNNNNFDTIDSSITNHYYLNTTTTTSNPTTNTTTTTNKCDIKSYNIIIHRKKILELAYRCATPIPDNGLVNLPIYNIIDWKGIYLCLEHNTKKIRSIKYRQNKNKIVFSIDFLEYYRSNDFSLSKVEPDKDYIRIIKTMFKLKHLIENGELESFSKRTISTFIRCYFQYVKYAFTCYKSIHDKKMLLLKEKLNHINEKQLDEYFPTTTTNLDIIHKEVKNTTKSYKFLNKFTIRITLVQLRKDKEIDLDIGYTFLSINTIENPLRGKIGKYYDSLLEFIDDIQKNSLLSSFSEEYKEIFSPLLKDRRLVSVKPLLQIEQ